VLETHGARPVNSFGRPRWLPRREFYNEKLRAQWRFLEMRRRETVDLFWPRCRWPAAWARARLGWQLAGMDACAAVRECWTAAAAFREGATDGAPQRIQFHVDNLRDPMVFRIAGQQACGICWPRRLFVWHELPLSSAQKALSVQCTGP